VFCPAEDCECTFWTTGVRVPSSCWIDKNALSVEAGGGCGDDAVTVGEERDGRCGARIEAVALEEVTVV